VLELIMIMASSSDSGKKWIFSESQVENSPSILSKQFTPKTELETRHQATSLIQDIGQKLLVNQLCINTAMVYMHRFYMYKSFDKYSYHKFCPVFIFLAAKVEEQPKKLERVLKVAHSCLKPDKPLSPSDLKIASDEFVTYELLLLEILGFDVSVDHPHTHVVKCTRLFKGSKDLSHLAYYLATNNLHLTTLCLRYDSTVVAAMCIYMACKWINYCIPLSNDNKPYWEYMGEGITEGLLKNLADEFRNILSVYPSKLKKLMNASRQNSSSSDKNAAVSNDLQNKPGTSSMVYTSSSAGSSRPPTASIKNTQVESQKKQPNVVSIEQYNKRKGRLPFYPDQCSGSRPAPHSSNQMTINQMPPARGQPSSTRESVAKFKTDKSGSSIHHGNDFNGAASVPPRPHDNVPRSQPRVQPSRSGATSVGNSFVDHGSRYQQYPNNRTYTNNTRGDNFGQVEKLSADKHPNRPVIDASAKMASRKPTARPYDASLQKSVLDVHTFNQEIMAKMYVKDPSALRVFLKYNLAQKRSLTHAEKSCLMKLEKSRNARREKHAAANAAAGSVVPPSSSQSTSSRSHFPQNPSKSFYTTPSTTRKRPNPESSNHVDPSTIKYAKRPEDVLKQRHTKEHRTQPPVSQPPSSSHRLEEQSGRERSSKDHRMQPHMSLPSSHKPHYKNAMPK